MGTSLLRGWGELDDPLRFAISSAIDALASCLFGFLSAEIASFNSASTLAFFCALSSSVPTVDALLDKALRDLSFKDLSTLIIRSKLAGSLASRFKPGMAAGVADLILANTSTGLREAVLFCCSLSSAFSSALGATAAAGRFVAAPGLVDALPGKDAAGLLGLGGVTATGPPSFWFKSAHVSGSRPAKLIWTLISSQFQATGFRITYNGTMMSTQKSFKGSEFILSDFWAP